MIPVLLRLGNAEIVSYALLDNGSDVTMIKSDCLRSFGLKEDQASVAVQTVSGNRTTKVTNAPFEVYSLDRPEHVMIERALEKFYCCLIATCRKHTECQTSGWVEGKAHTL